MKKYIKNLILFINNFLICHNLVKKEYSIIKRYYKLDFFGKEVSTKLLNQKNFNLNKVVGQFIDDPC